MKNKSRFQINKRKTTGYNVVEFKPYFGGQKVKYFPTKKGALGYIKRKK